ncbi:YnhF family membrane protein [Vibrio marisflavi]|uniref:YnhF family membrane protein n=1 Tax=Vibrio marisflavi CECT 7928 TaxID=634439 RepID=A0ABN8E527_9VIBR|nr:YnhF family membrane protein [Vibrio marisflavi]CAH0539279.1 hypothetical protein VMF7928_02036 [Vibrio marisflavi CECT 7928]
MENDLKYAIIIAAVTLMYLLGFGIVAITTN